MKPRRVNEVKESGDVEKMKALIDELFEGMMMEQDDKNYARAILDGSWPQSVSILTRALAKAQAMAHESDAKQKDSLKDAL